MSSNEMETSSSVTVVGLGRMGSALASAFARGGQDVTVWNRTVGRAEPLRALGVVVADSIVDACAASATTVMCVANYDVARALLHQDGVSAALRDKTLVQFTSGTAPDGRDLAEWAASAGVAHLEGKVMCYPGAVGTPQAVLLYAGSSIVFETAKPLLAALGGDPIYVGDDVGHAAALDAALIINTLALYVANMVGRAVCAREGIPGETWSFFEQVLLADAPALVADLNDRLEHKDYAGDQASLATWAHGAELIRSYMTASELDASLTASFDDVMRKAMAHGRADDGLAAIYDVLNGTIP